MASGFLRSRFLIEAHQNHEDKDEDEDEDEDEIELSAAAIAIAMESGRVGTSKMKTRSSVGAASGGGSGSISSLSHSSNFSSHMTPTPNPHMKMKMKAKTKTFSDIDGLTVKTELGDSRFGRASKEHRKLYWAGSRQLATAEKEKSLYSSLGSSDNNDNDGGRESYDSGLNLDHLSDDWNVATVDV